MSLVRRTLSVFFSRSASFLLRLMGWKRSVVYANLRHVSAAIPLLGSSEPEARFFYCNLVKNLAQHAGELLFRFNTFKKLPADTAAYPCTLDGLDFRLAEGSAPILEKMRGGGLFLTAHFGNYEAIGPWLCRLGIPLVASYIPLRPAWLNRILDRKIRAVDGRPYGVDARTPREFLRLLDDGKLFCLLADQDSRIPSALDGEFLSRPVHNNPLPDFLLKHRPATPVFICWLEDATVQGSSCAPPETGKRNRACRILHAEQLEFQTNENSSTCVMDAYNRWLESRIKENPSLWYGFTHRRFYSVESSIYP